jgi:hypothetical protein
MPNAAIPTGIRSMISSRAIGLAERVTSYSLLNFPLDVNDLETRINDPVPLDMMRTLQGLGIEQPVSNDINVCLLRSDIPALKRGVIVRLDYLPKHILVPRRGVMGTVYNFNWADPPSSKHKNAAYMLNLDGLDENKLQALGTWANNAVYNWRMQKLVAEIVTQTIHHEKYTRTIGHLHAWWPALCDMVDASEKVWQDRMRNPPRRNLNIYKPDDAAAHAKYAKHRELADHVFVKARMLPAYKHPEGMSRALIMHVEKLQGDVYI